MDDNKLLTLPNGERLSLPSNVRIMFEVDTLKYATLATVSRCGMIWFSDETITIDMLLENYISNLRKSSIDGDSFDSEDHISETLVSQRSVADVISALFFGDNLVSNVLQKAYSLDHIMDFSKTRAIETFLSLLNKTVRNVLDYNSTHSDFQMSKDHLEKYVSKRFLLCLVWSFAGDAKLDIRAELGRFICNFISIDVPVIDSSGSIIDFDVNIETGEWFEWKSKVPIMELSTTGSFTSSDIVIPTIDTIRHEEVLYSWLSEHKPLVLCGPPGINF